MAKSVLQQESAYYEESKKHITELNFEPYVGNYYVGAVIDNCFELYYSAPKIADAKEIHMKTSYDEKFVTFSGLLLNVDESISFVGCEKVIFTDCNLYGGIHRMLFNNVGTVMFVNCKFFDFGDKVAECFGINHFIVKKCVFNKCFFSSDDGIVRGGVFSVHDANHQGMEEIMLEGNDYYTTAAMIGRFNAENFMEENNVATGELTRIFED